MSPAEAMYARKIRPVFEKLQPKQIKPAKITVPKRNYLPGERIFFQVHMNNNTFWERYNKKTGLAVWYIWWKDHTVPRKTLEPDTETLFG